MLIRPLLRDSKSIGLCTVAFGAAMFAVGCSTPVNVPSMLAELEVSAPEPDVRTVKGDWDDLDAAMFTGMEEAEVAILPDVPGAKHSTDLSTQFRVFELHSVAYESGTLAAAYDPATGIFTLRAEIGRPAPSPPNTKRAAILLDAVARRLAELRGVGWRDPDTGQAGE